MQKIQLRTRLASERALDAIDEVLLSIGVSGRQPDNWEGEHADRAIDEVDRGNYEFAESLAWKALTPKSDRSLSARFSGAAPSLQRLREKFELVRLKPVRAHPLFGPVVYIPTRGATAG